MTAALSAGTIHQALYLPSTTLLGVKSSPAKGFL
jgi:hypothetical protein